MNCNQFVFDSPIYSGNRYIFDSPCYVPTADGAAGGHGAYIPPIRPTVREPVETDIQKRDNRIELAVLAIIALEEIENDYD